MSEILVKVYENKISIEKAYKKIYKTKKTLKKARYVKLRISIPKSKGVTILLKTLFLMPLPIWLLKFILKNNDRVINDSFPVKINDLLKYGLFKKTFIKVNSSDGVKVLLKTI